jgi:hypothetical protein
MAKRKRKPIVNYQKYSVLEFIDLVRYVIQCMTGNANFASPNPPLDELGDKDDKLAVAELKARGGTPDDTQDMYDKRAELEHLFEKEGLYIYLITDGDETKMLSSGYPLTSEDIAPAKHPIFWLKQGPNPGEILAGCKAVKGAKAYIWVYFVGENKPTDPKDWNLFNGSTQAKILINMLTSKTKVWVRVKPIIKDRSGVWSDALDIMVP